MSIFTRGRERIATLERETEELRVINQRLKNVNTEIRSRERVISKLFSQRTAHGSMSSELYNQAFPDANKYSGALPAYRSFWSSSNEQLRRLSRIAAFESPTGAAMIGGLTDVVVGAGLRLQSEPTWDLIVYELQKERLISPAKAAEMLDPEWQRKWRKNVEQRYKLWAKGYGPSYDNERNLHQIDRDCFRYLLLDGEYFIVLRYNYSRKGNPLSVQIIPPENVQGQAGAIAEGHTIENGIEYDASGAAVAYHILNSRTGEIKRIPRFGSRSGRVFVIHNYLKVTENQKRGVPYLSNVIHELTKLGDYEVLEIQAAIVNALFAVWVKPPDDEDGEASIGGGTLKKSDTSPTASVDDPTGEYLAKTQTMDFTHGGVIVDSLPAGHEIESFDTKRPNQGFDNFFQAVKRNLSAAKRQPLSVVDLSFNESYSGARGELLLFWMGVEQLRLNHAWDFSDDIYCMWMWGEVDRGRIEAPGFNYDQFLREAYSNAVWTGNQRPDIDPVKSVTAHILEQKQAYKTGHQITAERGGGDYEENLQVVQGEFDSLSEIHKVEEGSKGVTSPSSRSAEDIVMAALTKVMQDVGS